MASTKKKTKSAKVAAPVGRRCPKCGGLMVKGVCTKCKYSSKTAYKSRREAKEYTFAAD